jgi:hypothetical protein
LLLKLNRLCTVVEWSVELFRFFALQLPDGLMLLLIIVFGAPIAASEWVVELERLLLIHIDREWPQVGQKQRIKESHADGDHQHARERSVKDLRS